MKVWIHLIRYDSNSTVVHSIAEINFWSIVWISFYILLVKIKKQKFRNFLMKLGVGKDNRVQGFFDPCHSLILPNTPFKNMLASCNQSGIKYEDMLLDLWKQDEIMWCACKVNRNPFVCKIPSWVEKKGIHHVPNHLLRIYWRTNWAHIEVWGTSPLSSALRAPERGLECKFIGIITNKFALFTQCSFMLGYALFLRCSLTLQLS